jgi:ring-1,2-phenylacetyl-CoA epoxidase subunit PaaB
MPSEKGWPLYEVFVRARSALEHKHVGSVHAADDAMAIEHARDVYTRRQEGVSLWVMRSTAIHAWDDSESNAPLTSDPTLRENRHA